MCVGGGIVPIIIALILLGLIIEYGKYLFWLAIFGIATWVLVKIFSPKEKPPELPASTKYNPSNYQTTNHQTTNSYQYSNQSTSYSRNVTRTESKSLWVEEGRTVSVSDYIIPGGMIYLGTGLAAPGGYGTDCALINPQLAVSKFNCDYRVRKMDYWPSYSDTSPESRGAYLKWLSTGKNDPEADIGYVFLYFYGLERRLLHDLANSRTAENEIQAIQKEIERLLSIYGGNGSFNMYANSLLAYVKADDHMKAIIYDQAAPAATYHAGVPFELGVGLGQMVRDGVAILPEWALAWYLSTPNPPMFARTAAQRCKDEFQKMFAEEYVKAFGTGIKLTPNKTKLTFSHRPASRSLLSSGTYTKTLDLPDVTVLTSPIKKLAPLVQTCHDRLDSYSRFLGRNPDKIGTLDALLELPASLWPNTVKEAINKLKLNASQSSRPLEIKLSSLLSEFPEWKDRSKKRMGLFLDALGHHYNLGIEPDCRLGGPIPDIDSDVVIYDSGKANQSIIVSPHYAFASLAMHLAVLVSQVDGQVSEEEITMLLHQTDKWVYLKPEEQRRLKAHVLWLIKQNLKMSSVKKRIEALDEAQKEMVGNLIIQVSQVDGTIQVDEMKLLERIFKVLGIDSADLYSKIHQAAIEPVTLVAASSTGGGFSLPTPPTKEGISLPERLKIDMSKVAALQADSEKVTSILSTIFSEEETTIETVDLDQYSDDETVQEEPGIESLWGLPPSLSELVQTLCSKQTWDRTELEELAEDRGLMLEGALEQINEAAYDKFDQPFSEGDDIIEINQEIVMVMKQ